jgi:hypothetical protein
MLFNRTGLNLAVMRLTTPPAARCRFDCFYRVERTSSRAGAIPAEVQRLLRRTVSPITA